MIDSSLSRRPLDTCVVGLLWLHSVSLVGCAETVRSATEAAAPAAVESTVDELQEPYNRDKIAAILQDEEIRAATSELMGNIAGGAFDALTEKERAERLAIATEAYTSQLTVSFAERWEQEMGPRLSGTFERVLEESLARVLSEDTEARAGSMARSIAREAALGFQDAVRDSQLRRDGATREEADILATVGDVADATETVLDWTPWIIGILAAVLGAALGFLAAQRSPRVVTTVRSTSQH
jgi:hypothetical protein